MKWPRVLKMIGVLLLASILLCAAYIEYVYRQPVQNSVYDEFLLKIKFAQYDEAYRLLCPLVRQKDPEAMMLVALAYAQGHMGVPVNRLKAQIWEERIIQKSFDTGVEEYAQFTVFLRNRDHQNASLLLLQAANKGNMNAIRHVQDADFLLSKQLIIPMEAQTEWLLFDNRTLYPIDNCI